MSPSKRPPPIPQAWRSRPQPPLSPQHHQQQNFKVRKEARARRGFRAEVGVGGEEGSLPRPRALPCTPFSHLHTSTASWLNPARDSAVLRPQKWSTSSLAPRALRAAPRASAQQQRLDVGRGAAWSTGERSVGHALGWEQGSVHPHVASAPRALGELFKFRFLSPCGLGKAYKGLRLIHLPLSLTRVPRISGSAPAGAAKLLLLSRRGRL